ncbi:MAG TPA: alkaline phosphatase family protein [Acidimicrobiales bacterium]|nr:alkaline phosphatase family protein [Acidimicrobiales bacterium]
MKRAPLALAGAITCLLAGLAGLPARAAQPAAGLEKIPRFDHVVVLVEENEAESTTFGTTSPAHYLNSLRSKGVFLPNYYGTGHASLDNYIAMVSGQPDNPATAGDCEELSLYNCTQIQAGYDNGRNLGDQLDSAGVSWKSYMDSTPTPCFHAPYSAASPAPDPYQGDSQKPPARDYADRHNPFVWFPDFVGNQSRCAVHQRPYTELAGDLRHNALPQFAFITPDTCHDGHDDPCSSGQPGGLVSLDAWAKANIPPLLDYLWHHNGLLIVNFDEGAVDLNDVCPSCASGGLGGRTGAIFLSPRLKAGSVVTAEYDHMSLLRTLEDSFGIAEHLNLAGQAQAMSAVFAGGAR